MPLSEEQFERLMLRFLVHLGRAVKREREILGVTQEDVARVSGLSKSELQFVESGSRNVKLATLFRVCLSLAGSNLSQLVTETEGLLMDNSQDLFLWARVKHECRAEMLAVSKARRRPSCE